MTLKFFRHDSNAPRGRESSHLERRSRPTLEALEDRLVLYSVTGFEMANPNVSVSYMPDGTNVEGYSSRLFNQLNAIAPTATWQREFARALQTWAQYAPLNFHFVSDDGSPGGTFGLVQGDSRFGDIRLGTRVLGSNVLGYTHFPNIGTSGYNEGGDIALNSNMAYSLG